MSQTASSAVSLGITAQVERKQSARTVPSHPKTVAFVSIACLETNATQLLDLRLLACQGHSTMERFKHVRYALQGRTKMKREAHTASHVPQGFMQVIRE